MLKFIKIFSFVAICTIAAFAGAQPGGTYIVEDQECFNWKCKGKSEFGCTFNETRTIQTCFVVFDPDGCEVESFAFMECIGVDGMGWLCGHWYPKCIHPVNP